MISSLPGGPVTLFANAMPPYLQAVVVLLVIGVGRGVESVVLEYRLAVHNSAAAHLHHRRGFKTQRPFGV